MGELSRAPLWGVVGSRERERGDVRGDASLKFSGEGHVTGAAGGLKGWGGLGLGLEYSSSDSRIKSSQSCWDNVTGEGEQRRFLVVDWGGKMGAA